MILTESIVDEALKEAPYVATIYEKINWEQLREQKEWLQAMANYVDNPIHAVGLIHLTDALQDYAVDSGTFDELTVFGVMHDAE